MRHVFTPEDRANGQEANRRNRAEDRAWSRVYMALHGPHVVRVPTIGLTGPPFINRGATAATGSFPYYGGAK